MLPRTGLMLHALTVSLLAGCFLVLFVASTGREPVSGLFFFCPEPGPFVVARLGRRLALVVALLNGLPWRAFGWLQRVAHI